MKKYLLLLAVVLLLDTQTGFAQTSPSGAKDYSGIRMWANPARGAAGQPIRIDVHYAGLPVSGDARVAYTTEGALQLVTPAQKPIMPDHRKAFDDAVIVQARADGAYFLNVFATTASGTSVISVPVTVGAAVHKPHAATSASSVSAPDGGRVIEMPAQETRR